MPEATSSRNSRRAWTAEQVQQLRELADGTPIGVMSVKLGRSQDRSGRRPARRRTRNELTAGRMLVPWRALGDAGNATGSTSPSTTGSARTGTSR
jgi:hypothetical protein